MMDYTLEGVPVPKVSTSDLKECLTNGVQINDAVGLSFAEAEQRVFERIKLELEIRRLPK